MSACKVAAVVCTAALTAGGAVEVRHLTSQHRDGPARTAAQAAAAPTPAAPRKRAFVAPSAIHSYAPKTERARVRDEVRHNKLERTGATKPTRDEAITAPPPAAAQPAEPPAPVAEPNVSGGTLAPPAAGEEPDQATKPPVTAPAPTEPVEAGTTAPGGTTGTPPAEPDSGTPPTEH